MLLQLLDISLVLTSALLFLVFSVAGSAALLKRSGVKSDLAAPLSRFEQVARTRVFATFEILLAAWFVAPRNSLLPGLAAGFALLIALLGLWQGKACDCVGSYTPASTRHQQLLRLAISGIAALHLMVDLTLRRAEPNPLPSHTSTVWIFTWGLAAILILREALTSIAYSPEGPERIPHPAESPAMPGARKEISPRTLDPDMPLGYQGEQPILLKNAFERNRVALVVFVSENCSYCRQLLPYIGVFKASFTPSFSIWIVYGSRPEAAEGENHDGVLLDEKKVLFNSLGLTGAPAAVLLSGDRYAPMAPVSYGVERIRLLLTIAYNLVHPEKKKAE
ncbi:hypothetical protein ACQ859_02265 [Roseateles chitinivorans]|uniref:hypothetical protein n=1 Tax=Roseateles chitinivorans TaxID=2917965 RepID=UPI003D66E1CA